MWKYIALLGLFDLAFAESLLVEPTSSALVRGFPLYAGIGHLLIGIGFALATALCSIDLVYRALAGANGKYLTLIRFLAQGTSLVMTALLVAAVVWIWALHLTMFSSVIFWLFIVLGQGFMLQPGKKMFPTRQELEAEDQLRQRIEAHEQKEQP